MGLRIYINTINCVVNTSQLIVVLTESSKSGEKNQDLTCTVLGIKYQLVTMEGRSDIDKSEKAN